MLNKNQIRFLYPNNYAIQMAIGNMACPAESFSSNPIIPFEEINGIRFFSKKLLDQISLLDKWAKELSKELVPQQSNSSIFHATSQKIKAENEILVTVKGYLINVQNMICLPGSAYFRNKIHFLAMSNDLSLDTNKTLIAVEKDESLYLLYEELNLLHEIPNIQDELHLSTFENVYTNCQIPIDFVNFDGQDSLTTQYKFLIDEIINKPERNTNLFALRFTFSVHGTGDKEERELRLGKIKEAFESQYDLLEYKIWKIAPNTPNPKVGRVQYVLLIGKRKETPREKFKINLTETTNIEEFVTAQDFFGKTINPQEIRKLALSQNILPMKKGSCNLYPKSFLESLK